MRRKKWFKRLLLTILIVFVVGELVGRYFGLHTYPLYLSSDTYEYIHAPNQDFTIYRNRLKTNSVCMRSEEPLDDGTTVLTIGDSVINGGNLTDHDSLATTRLEPMLEERWGTPVQVLNLSAGSWGPDNAAAFVEEKGHFGADCMVLVVSSHDSHDNITHQKVVDINPQFPGTNYSLAWMKLVERGWQQVSTKMGWSDAPSKLSNAQLGIDTSEEFNTGFDYFYELSQEQEIPLLVFLHVTQLEINRGDYNAYGKEIVDYCQNKGIPIFLELDNPPSATAFRDNIHYSEAGQRFLAEQLAIALKDI